jgi:TonB family protein
MTRMACSTSATKHNGLRVRFVCVASALCALVFLFRPQVSTAENVPTHAAIDRSGELPIGEALALNLTTDLGCVAVRTLPPNSPSVVRYTVHIETDAREPLAHSLLEKYVLTARGTRYNVLLSGSLPTLRAQSGKDAQFWVQFTVYVPANFGVEVNTGVGDIETSDVGGRAILITQGGNIRAGRIGSPHMRQTSPEHPVAKLETQGGHISVQDVAGDLDAYTAGGHIQAGNIAGNAKLLTGGGHIRAGQIKGSAKLETEGGNITVGDAGSFVSVRTGGGQIDFGEVHGSVHAQTAGGGIRVMYVSGPMEVETSGGSICLTRVVNTVRAATDGGTITAWITPDSHDPDHAVQLAGPSQLSSGTGDIVVFLPRNIAATIDATVENGGASRIESDPALPLNVQVRPDGPAHGVGVLNGGGAMLKLRSTAGKIRLQYVDTEMALRQSLLEEQKQRLAQRLSEMGFEQVTMRSQPPAPPTASAPAHQEESGDWFGQWKSRLEITFLGGVHEDPEEFRKHLTSSPAPDYPQVARRAGLQGLVKIQVRIKADGTVVVEKVLEGEPALVEAAEAAIRQWRAQPEEISGKKVDVISTMTFNFQLH